MTAMSDAARHVLHVVALREGLPVDGWEHYATSTGDDGASLFYYDRDPAQGPPAGLAIRCSAEGYAIDRERSWLDQLS